MSKNVVVAGYGEDFDMRNRRNRQVKMCQLFFYSSLGYFRKEIEIWKGVVKL